MAIKIKASVIKSKSSQTKPPKKVQKVSAVVRKGDDDWVQISMTRTITSPVVGTFNVQEELSRKQLKEGKSYFLPPNVAGHLKDIGACIIVGQPDDEDEDQTEVEDD